MLNSSKQASAAIILSIGTVLAGCASFDHNTTESVRLAPDNLDAGSAIKQANDNAQWPTAQWWTGFQDTQLSTLINRSLTKNPTLAIAQARVREAESAANMARASLYPHVDGSMALGQKHFPDNTYYGPGAYNHTTTWNNTGALSLTYHMDLWGSDRNAVARSLSAAQAASADERAATIELESNLVRTYLTLSLTYQLRDIAASTLEQQEHIATIARKRFDGGLGTRLDLSQAVAPLPEYKRQIQVYDLTISLTKNQLAALTGEGPGFGETISRPKLSLQTRAALPSTLPAELLGRRPDVVAARWMVAARARGIDVAKAQFYPNVNLLASVSQMAAGGTFLNFLHPAGTGWTAGPALTLPIFEGGALRAQLGMARAQYDEAVDSYNAILISALKDVSDQVLNVQSLDDQIVNARSSVSAANDSYSLAETGYKRGLTDYLNTLAAQMQLLKAREGLARVQVLQLQAFASLQTSLGGGAQIPLDTPRDEQELPSKHLSPLAAALSDRGKK